MEATQIGSDSTSSQGVIEDLYMICRGLVWVMKLSYDFDTCYVSLSLAFGVCICIDGKWRENI